MIGQIGGLAVDRHDRIWVLQRALAYAVDEKGAKHDLAPGQRMPAVLVTVGLMLLRWAVVLADQKENTAVLDLWSLSEGRSLARLGSYPRAGLTVTFSPGGRWLVIRQATGRVEVREVPPGLRRWTFSPPGARVRHEFDEAEKRLLLVGPSYEPFAPDWRKGLDPAFGRVIDLRTGAIPQKPRVARAKPLSPGDP